MNKNVFLVFFSAFFIQIFSLQSYEHTLEFRTAGFFHSSSNFNDIYGHVNENYQVEASTGIYRDIKGFVNFDWLSDSGSKKTFYSRTSIKIFNVSFGLKLPYRVSEKISLYIGIGPSFAKLNLKNRSFCASRTQTFSKWSYGVVLKSGMNLEITNRLFANIFLDYFYQPVRTYSTVDIGGVKVGIGLGVKF